MKKHSWRRWLVGLVILLALGVGVWRYLAGRGGTEEKKDTEGEPTAQVRVAPLRRGTIERTLVAYGTAAAAPGGTRSLAYPFESRIVAVQANLGQSVAEGDPLLQIEASVDARLALDTARGAQQSADKTLQDTQARFKARLATNADLVTAENAARDARLKLDSLQSRAPDAQGVVRSPAAGVVTKLPAGPGTVVPAGGPLVEVAVEKRFEARLGVAPSDAAQIKPGQAVHLWPVQANGGEAAKAEPMRGTVRVVGGSIDPATRLVDAFVALDDTGAPVLIGTFLRAGIVVEKKEALLAPRGAILPEEGGGEGGTIFTVTQDHARKHAVETGIDDGENVEIAKGDDALAPGVDVVTEGAYELEDKMPVEIAKPLGKDDADKADSENSPGKASAENSVGKSAADPGTGAKKQSDKEEKAP